MNVIKKNLETISKLLVGYKHTRDRELSGTSEDCFAALLLGIILPFTFKDRNKSGNSSSSLQNQIQHLYFTVQSNQHLTQVLNPRLK